MTIVIYHVKKPLCYGSIVRKTNPSKVVSLQVLRLIREERIRQGLSMNGLAKKAGLSQSMVSLLDRGLRNPTLEVLLRITNALDIDLSKLIRRASKNR